MPRINWSIRKLLFILISAIPFLLISYYRSIDTRNVRGNWNAIWLIYLFTTLYYLFQKEKPDPYRRTRSYLSPEERAEWKKFQKERREYGQKNSAGLSFETGFNSPLLLIFLPSMIIIVSMTFTPNIEPPLMLSIIVPLILLDLGLLSLYNKRLIDDIPTSKTMGAFVGHVELKGTAESENPLTSFISGTKCVLYSWSVMEKNDSTYWITLSEGGQSSTFYLKDDTGAIRIDPKNALLYTSTILNFSDDQNTNLSYDKRTSSDMNPSKGIRRYREKLIPLHAQIYVIGHARERKDQVAVEIAYDEDDPVYVISTRGEKRVSSEYWERFTIFTIVGFIISIILPWLSISGRLMDPLSIAPLTMTELNPRICFVPSIIFVISLFIGWALVIFNSLVNLRNVVDHAWSMIDIQLNRRSDLIPNLVEVLEGYSKHEEAIYSQITVLRSQTLRQEAPIGVTSLLQSVAEDYPELKAGQKFLELQQAVEETEQRIALARDYYNNQTRFYNTRLEMVPDSYMASLGGFIRREYWMAESFKRAQEEINLVS